MLKFTDLNITKTVKKTLPQFIPKRIIGKYHTQYLSITEKTRTETLGGIHDHMFTQNISQTCNLTKALLSRLLNRRCLISNTKKCIQQPKLKLTLNS